MRGRAIPVYSYVNSDLISFTGGATIITVAPQRGKTRAVVRSFVKYARHGDTLIYLVSSHAEAASVIKHYIDIQRELGWQARVLLVSYAGLNRWCPLYNKIRRERELLKENYSQTKFCRKHCSLWRMKPVKKGIFEQGKPGIYVKHPEKNIKITWGPARLILNKYSWKVFKHVYKQYNSPDVANHTVIISDEEHEQKWGEPLYIRGCIRAFLLRKLIDKTPRDERGRLKGKERRSVYGYPTIIVGPHQLGPLLLHFAMVYSNRVFVAIDEFDRLLQYKVPLYLAKKFERKLNEEEYKQWDWFDVLYNYYYKEEMKSEKQYDNMIPPIINIKMKKVGEKKEGWMVKVIKAPAEVPLITLISYKLRQLKEKGKLVWVGVIGSSIPLLPFSIQKYLVEWLSELSIDITLYYSIVDVPAPDFIVNNVQGVLHQLKNTLIVTGSKKLALQLARSNINITGIEINLPRRYKIEDLADAINSICSNDKYETTLTYCIRKDRRVGYLIYPILNNDNTVSRLKLLKLNLRGDYIKLGTTYVTWLGGRLTRGVQLPPHIKTLIVFTTGRTEENEAIHVRISDMIQVVFRINSRPDMVLGVSTWALEFIKLAVKWYNKHTLKLVQYVTTGGTESAQKGKQI